MSDTPTNEPIPSDGERNALVGFSAQFALAARVVQRHLASLEWIRVADPSAGVADDFQFLSAGRRHALQVKWSQFPGSFTWSDLAGRSGQNPALLADLASSWKRLRADWDGPLTIHLCTNNFPSTSAPAGTSALGQADNPPRHFAAFLARSLEPLAVRLRTNLTETWDDVARVDLVTHWSYAWEALHAASGLTPNQFASFLRDFSITFVPPDQSVLVTAADSADLNHLASTLQGLVVDPARLVQLSRSELLTRLGWTDRLRYQHPHRFPVPETYTANTGARSALEVALTNHLSGYLALVGPPGSGKSTLIESLAVPGRMVRYYAFVPDSPDPLSGRGEAQSFLHDLALALEEAGIPRKGFSSDLAGQRAVLLDQLDRAGELFANDGVRTTIIVDGLDHIPREQNPTRSLLNELPAPAALPHGVCVLLGTQTTEILPLAVREALGSKDRIVDVPPLSGEEVRTIASLAGIADWMLPGQVSDLVEVSEGHPLVLTYLTEDLRALEIEEDLDYRRNLVDRVLADASDHRGSIDLRYTRYLGSVLEDNEVLSVLGTVCRLRVPVHLEWLATWVDPAAVSRFTSQTSTFFRRRGGEWNFIHNSFRRFLVDETAKVAGEYRESRSRELHELLADRCAESTGWPLYQDEELIQRYLAGQFERVLEASRPEMLRENLFKGRPYGVVRDQAIVAIRAAADAQNHRALIRSLMFLNELHQRRYVLGPDAVAKVLAEVEPRSAVEHVVQGRTLRIDSAPALHVAGKLAAVGLIEDADSILRAAGGLQGLIGDRKFAGIRQQEWIDSIADWSEVTWYRSGLTRVLDEVDHLLPLPEDEEQPPVYSADGADPEDWQKERDVREAREVRDAVRYARNAVHARCYDLADLVRDGASKAILATRIKAESNVDWQARMSVIDARSAQVDGKSAEVLRQVQEMLSLEDGAASRPKTPNPDETEQSGQLVIASSDPDEYDVGRDEEDASLVPHVISLALRVPAAEALVRAGLGDSRELARLLPPETRVAWPSSIAASGGMAPFNTMLGLLRIRRVSDLVDIYETETKAESTVDGADNDPARRRFFSALKTVADLEAQAIAASLGVGAPPDVPALSEPVVHMMEVPIRTSRDWTGWYSVAEAAPDLYERLMTLAYRCGGQDQLSRLLARFQAAWESSDRSSYWPIKRRLAVVAAGSGFGGAEEWSRAQLDSLELAISESGADPNDRATAWLELAKARAKLGDQVAAFQALGSASRDGWGPGQHHDDDQLVTWLPWLFDAVRHGSIERHDFLNECRSYASRLLIASKEAESQAGEAASDLTAALFQYDAALACELAEALCDQGVFAEAEMVAAFVRGAGNRMDTDLSVVASLLTQVLMPMSTSTPAELEDTLIARSPDPDALRAEFESTKALWAVPDTRRLGDSPSTTDSAAAEEAPDESPLLLSTVLGQMRSKAPQDVTQGDLARWMRAVDASANHPPLAVAVDILDEAGRLGLDGESIATIAGMASRAGALENARLAISSILARTAPYGWLVRYDGGTRVRIFEAAIARPDDNLVDLAARDLAGLVASRAIAGEFSPNDLRRFAKLLGGLELVAECWQDVRSYLDAYAPASNEIAGLSGRVGGAPTEELLRWVAGQLGHPVRIIDFGARRALANAVVQCPGEVQAVLAELIAIGGWAAEAGLHVLVEIRRRFHADLSTDLLDAVTQAASSSDGIIRLLASRLLVTDRREVAECPYRELPMVYHLELPPLPKRTVPELDHEGIPYIDMTDPQQVIGPFDQPLDAVAEVVGLGTSAMIRHAASLARETNERWTKGGHRAHADRLKARGNRHTYRPWAYMVGRRACAKVLADLIDARLLAGGERSPILACMIDETLNTISPEPLDDTTPLPWRAPDSKDYPSEEWCTEAPGAADDYSTKLSGSRVIAERSNWRWLDWALPEEERWIRTLHGRPKSSLLITPTNQSAWEETWNTASNYPALPDLEWGDQQLVVYGREPYSDPEHMDWLALHPAVATHLDWVPGAGAFEWLGRDGAWRARTVRRVRGQLSHDPPSDAICGDVWQVVLSEQGYSELYSAFPALERTIEVRRILPANRRKGRTPLQLSGTSPIDD